jgi:hypothetical protein
MAGKYSNSSATVCSPLFRSASRRSAQNLLHAVAEARQAMVAAKPVVRR